MQPVGDATIFDSSAFRLVKTHAFVIVKLKSGGEVVYSAEDQLYFENIPENNGVVGMVRYEFLVLKQTASGQLTPYQEVASGYDNEKFNGDYGANFGIISTTTDVRLAKSVDLTLTWPGTNLQYQMIFSNAGTKAVGNPELNMPLVVQDSIPTGTIYIAGSATNNNALPAGVTSYQVLFSTNRGSSWLTSEPGVATNVTDVQWWLSGALQPAASGIVRFAVTIRNPYTFTNPIVLNYAGLSLGNTTPFLWDHTATRLLGTNSLGDTVFIDDGVGTNFANGVQNTGEIGISNVTVNLYLDSNNNGLIDAADVFLTNAVTAANGYYMFTNLFDGRYLAAIDTGDRDIPYGYASTTSLVYSVNLDYSGTNSAAVTFTNADFGFAPLLQLTKTLVSGSPTREGSNVTFSITVTNRVEGNGGFTEYTVWGIGGTSGAGTGSGWNDATNAWLPENVGPDGKYAYPPFSGNPENMTVTNFVKVAPVGRLTRVAIIMPFQAVGVKDDNVTVSLIQSGTSLYTTNMLISDLAARMRYGRLELDITSVKQWLWSDFSSTNTLSIELIAKKQASGGSTLNLDCVGFLLRTSWQGDSNPSETLDPVPLVDTYNTSNLQYVSSTRLPTSVTTSGSTGTVYWSNVGPIYPGGTSTVRVVFKALDPGIGVSSNIVTNITYVTSAVTYADRRPANTATSSASVVVLHAGEIGDLVWWDLNANGIKDNGETGIPNVSVVLVSTNVPTRTNVTDSTGYYLFEGLPSNGTYRIMVLTNTIGSGVINTYDEDGGANSSNVVFLANLEDHLTSDFGYRYLSGTNIIQGTIWRDLNWNGAPAPDPGELWLTNVTVYLYTGTTPGTPATAIATGRTDTAGYFWFSGNYSGNYNVQVVTNSGSMTNLSWSETYDTDGLGTASYATFNVTTAVTRVDFSYSMIGLYNIGDTLYYDWNGNGMQDANEEGITGVTVRLYVDVNSNRTLDVETDWLAGTTTTTTNGYYTFAHRYPSNYFVSVDMTSPALPARYRVTGDPYGNYDGQSYLVITNTSNTNQDFGFQPYGYGNIGDFVWRDFDGDGLQDGGLETGIPHIKLTLLADFNNDGLYVAITNTESTGSYLFANVPDGTYVVTVDTNDTDLPTDAYGYKYVLSTPASFTAVITNGSSYLFADFGFKPLGAIGDTIFWDSNRSGQQDWNEIGATGVTVRLYLDIDGDGIVTNGSSDTVYRTTVTTTNGFYLFAGLPTGNYVVVVDTNASPLTGTSISADPNTDGASAYLSTNALWIDSQYAYHVAPGTRFMGADFGYVPRGVIGDTLWLDMNNNGARDTNEVGIGYVSMILKTNGVVVATNATDADGYYIFSGWPNGTYTVEVLTNDTDFPAGLSPTFDLDGTGTANLATFAITNGQVRLDVDFGYRYAGTYTLSGTVGIEDVPYNGVMGNGPSGYSSNEVPFVESEVNLYYWIDNGDNVIQSGETHLIGSSTTTTNGDYSFSGLPPGDGNDKYIVSFGVPDDNLQLTTTVGVTPAMIVSNSVNAAGNTVSAWQAVPIAPAITNMDFAFKSTLRYDYGDLPDSYSTLLQDSPSGARNVVKATPDLYLGTLVDTEINGLPSVKADGDNLSLTNDEDGVSCKGMWYNGGTGQVQVVVGKGSGWLVGYMDFNNDGDFGDADEMIISQSATTNAGGGSRVYTNHFAIPASTISTASITTIYARFRLLPSQPAYPEVSYAGTASDGETEDYEWSLGSLGDTVWKDINSNDVRDAGEPGLTNVLVYVDINGNGVFDAGDFSTVTDTNGYYYIGGFTPGTYTVAVDAATIPVGLLPVFDLDGTGTLNRTSVTMTNGQVRTDVDFGYEGLSISGMVWYDSNSNGIRGDVSQEIPPIPMSNITVKLYYASNSNLVSTTSTGPDGRYEFIPTNATNYFVEFVPGSYTVSPQGDPSRSDVSDVSPSSPYRTTNITVTVRSGQNHWDMGLSTVTDLGITKTVNDMYPRTNQVIWFTVILTNNGPHDAYSCTVTDIWPDKVTYSNSWTSQGSYDPVARLWTAGRLDVGSFATLVITAQVNTVTSGSEIQMMTNYVRITDCLPGDSNPLNNTSQVAIATLAVLSRFEAVNAGGSVAVEWETVSEANTAGFYLYRKAPGSDQYARVSDEMMPSVPGSAQGGIYRMPDPGARPGKSETYRLEEMEATGGAIVHGPFTVEIPVITGSKTSMQTMSLSTAAGSFSSQPRTSSATAARLLAMERQTGNLATAAAGGLQTASLPAGSMTLASLPTSTAIKLAVTSDAAYSVTAEAIAGLTGASASEINSAILSGTLRLTLAGVDIAYLPSDDGSSLYFFGKKTDSIYSDANVYWLTIAQGKTVQVAATAFPTPAQVSVSRETAHFEINRYALAGTGLNPDGDYWMWDYMMSANSSFTTKSFTLNLVDVAKVSETAELTVRLFGSTSLGIAGEHHALIKLNGKVVGESTWEGLYAKSATFAFDQSSLLEGSNLVEVTAVKEAGVPYSTFYLNSFDVSYAKICRARADQILMHSSTNAVLTVAGFTTPEITVLDVSNPETPVRVTPLLIETDGGLYRASFTPLNAESTCVMFSRATAPATSMRLDVPSCLKNRDNSCDYLIITADALATAAQSLADYRQGKGLNSKVVLVQDIYDEFNNGLPSPHAIVSFIQYAWLNWNVAPRYLVLAGKGTYDYKNFLGYGENVVPPLMVMTPLGLSTSDSAYADVNHDGVPELAVGRLPAITAAELSRLVAKIIAYEASAPADWQKRLVLTTDNPDNGGNFAASSDQIAGLITTGFTASKAYMPSKTVAPTRALLLPALNQGALFLSYFGHGAIDRFAAEGLLTSADANSLTNGTRMPVVTAMSCSIGNFTRPGFNCLAETLLLRDGGGAIAVWAPSGLSLDEYAGSLDRNFYNEVFQRCDGILGEAILAAKQEYSCDQLMQYIPGIYNLLGDPALTVSQMTRLPAPPTMEVAGVGTIAADSATTMREWQQKWFTPTELANPRISSASADPDHDGIANIVEYAVALNPASHDARRRFSLTDLGAENDFDAILTYTRRKNALDVGFGVEVSADLSTWVNGAKFVKETEVTDDLNGLTETVSCRVRSPRPDRSTAFIRVLVSGQ